MDALRAAAPLARLLIALGDANHDGELWLQRPGGRARISLLHGQIVSVRGVEGEPLGDLLRARGEFPLGCPRRLAAMCHGRIGERLVAVGAASADAVQRALQRQLVQRLARLMRGPYDAVRMAPRLDDRGASPGQVGAVAAAWGVLWSLSSELPELSLNEVSGTGALALTELGVRRLPALERARTSGELASVLDTLDVSLPDGSFTQALAPNPQSTLHALRASLRCSGMVAGARTHGTRGLEGYALLLRKRRELLRNESARTLLDLPGGAGPEKARPALRRLARTLHPDRFEACDARLRALFGETMSALSRAEHALRTTP